jgi:transcriptional regulator with XRE-family HTH domain
MQELANRLRLLRVANELSIRTAAQRAGIRPATLGDIEHGRSRPQDTTLAKLARVYGVDIEELLPEESAQGVPLVSRDPPTERVVKEVALKWRILEPAFEVLREDASARERLVSELTDEEFEEWRRLFEKGRAA